MKALLQALLVVIAVLSCGQPLDNVRVERGMRGEAGPQGDVGISGAKGDVGEAGEGRQGPQGPQGNQGDLGDPGSPCSVTQSDGTTTIVCPGGTATIEERRVTICHCDNGTKSNLTLPISDMVTDHFDALLKGFDHMGPCQPEEPPIPSCPHISGFK